MSDDGPLDRSDRHSYYPNHLHGHRRHSRRGDAAATSNNLAFAGAVGDAVCCRNTRRSVVNDLHHAERQATGRAFTAELLAPIESVMDMGRRMERYRAFATPARRGARPQRAVGGRRAAGLLGAMERGGRASAAGSHRDQHQLTA